MSTPCRHTHPADPRLALARRPRGRPRRSGSRVYRQLLPLADWLVGLTPLDRHGHAGEALAFFLYDVPKVLMLLVLIVFVMGVVRSFFSPEKTRALLSGKAEGVGNAMAASLGIVTPFCSCSAVPLFIGFVSAGVPLGVTFSFLIAAPMVNEVALVLLFGLVGWKVAATYLGFGLALAIVAGWVIGRLKLEGWLQDWVRDDPHRRRRPPVPSARHDHDRPLPRGDRGGEGHRRQGLDLDPRRHRASARSSTATCPRTRWRGSWGPAPGGRCPPPSSWGIPMYTNAAGVIPIVEALLGKGAALGTVLAFMMSVIALSLPEMLILRKVLTIRLLAVFVGVVGTGILCVGFLFNLIF